MSDDPNFRGAADRARIATSEDYEVRYFVETMKKRFPGKTTERIEVALLQAREISGGSSSREVLTAAVRPLRPELARNSSGSRTGAPKGCWQAEGYSQALESKELERLAPTCHSMSHLLKRGSGVPELERDAPTPCPPSICFVDSGTRDPATSRWGRTAGPAAQSPVEQEHLRRIARPSFAKASEAVAVDPHPASALPISLTEDPAGSGWGRTAGTAAKAPVGQEHGDGSPGHPSLWLRGGAWRSIPPPGHNG
eukprot:gene47790-58550_t